MSHHFFYTGVLLLAIIWNLPQNVVAHAKRDTPNLPCVEADIYSISAEPVNADGSKSYRLSIFADAEEKKKIFTILRPLDGRITTVNINDIDHDNSNELVVVMKDEHSSTIYYDIFEFREKQLDLFSFFLKISKIFE